MRWMAKTGAALAGLALVTAVLPASGAERSVLRWDMNEPAGASEMEPSRGDLVGAIGDEVRTGRWVDGAQNYGFPFVTPNKPPARPEHLVMVPEDDRLDPDDEKLRITFRFRSKQNFGNVMQKGQARTAGGYWKFQMPNGKMVCLFRGADRTTRSANSKVPLNDGEWHKVTCVKTPNFVRMIVDGKVTKTRRGSTGPINNNKDMSIGGKPACDQIRVTCDYFTGGIDFVRIKKSPA